MISCDIPELMIRNSKYAFLRNKNTSNAASNISFDKNLRIKRIQKKKK